MFAFALRKGFLNPRISSRREALHAYRVERSISEEAMAEPALVPKFFDLRVHGQSLPELTSAHNWENSQLVGKK